MPRHGSAAGFVARPGVVVPVNISAQTAYADNYSTGLSIAKPLFAGFRFWNSMELKRQNFELAKAKYEDIKRQIYSSTVTSFYYLFILKENILLMGDMDKRLKDRMDYTKANFKAGASAQYDSIRAEVAYRNNRPQLLKISNSYVIAKKDLCNTIGAESATNTEFIGNLTDSTNIQISISEDEALPLAFSNDINLITLDYTVKNLNLSREIANSARMPVLAAFFNDKYAYGVEGFTATNRSWFNSWNAGLQLSIPLDTLLPFSKTACNIEESGQNIQKMELLRHQLKDGIVLRVENLLLQIDLAKQSIESQAETLNQAKLGLEIANNRYNAGASSLLDVTDAEVSYSQSKLAYLQALYDYFSSTVQLRRLLGM